MTHSVEIHQGYRPRLIAGVTDMHIGFYGQNYGFGAVFERKVATEMSEFIGRIDHPLNTVFSAYMGDTLVGSVSIDGEDLGDNVFHLRWFIVSDAAKGQGVGQKLMSKAIDFVDHYASFETHLWTFRGLDAARHLYERFGFHLAQEKAGVQWGSEVAEQMFIRPAKSKSD